MSEYQYYEFLAVDPPLTAAEQAEVRQRNQRLAGLRSQSSVSGASGGPLSIQAWMAGIRGPGFFLERGKARLLV